MNTHRIAWKIFGWAAFISLAATIIESTVAASFRVFRLPSIEHAGPAMLTLVWFLFVSAVSLHTLHSRRLRSTARVLWVIAGVATLGWLMYLPGISDAVSEETEWALYGFVLNANYAATLAVLVIRMVTSWDGPFWVQLLRAGTIAALSTAAVMFLLWIPFGEFMADSETIDIVIPISLTASAFGIPGTLLAGLASRTAAHSAAEHSLDRGVTIKAECARCGEPVALVSGKHVRCPGCRLAYFTQTEEPRCDCGYLLYGIKSDTCPECGKAVPDDLRWDEGEAGTPAATPSR